MARSTSSKVATPGVSIFEVPGWSFVLNLIISIRPGPWAETLRIFAGLRFGLRLFDPVAVIDATRYLAHRRAEGASPTDLLLRAES